MQPDRFAKIVAQYQRLNLVLLGDFCLDRYLEIDPSRAEISIETGLQVHNVTRVRSQPGGSGTILNNLVALGVGGIWPVGFCGDDGEGYELRRALGGLRGVDLAHFVTHPSRRTFTYCKPLLMHPGKAPEELNRLDSKNWDATPAELEDGLIRSLGALAPKADAIIVLDQVDRPDTGVVTRRVREALGDLAQKHPGLLVIADSRQGLGGWPAVGFKMNAAELATLLKRADTPELNTVREQALELARRNQRPVFITLSERGMVGALPDGSVEHVPTLPIRGPIDIVGAGDAVTANLTTAMASGATLRESLELSMAGASVVIHQLGTTGTASTPQLAHALAL